MPNFKKPKEEKLNPIMGSMTDDMQAALYSIGITNNKSRNDIIRIACAFLINNKKKFGLK